VWSIIPSLDSLLQGLAVAFTEPSFQTHREVLLGWIMCIGKRTEYRVFQTIRASSVVSRVGHHPFDRFYNFFSRSAWTVESLAHQVAVAVVTALNPTGLLYLVVDDTLLHKRGETVYGLGWFRDAVASTAKRVATASGNNWVVLGLAIPIPLVPDQILCLPLLARLHLPGEGSPSCVDLAAEMLGEVLRWFPGRRIVLIGDGAYASHGLLGGLDPRVAYAGRLRGDAEVYDPQVPPQPPGKRGRKPQKGPRLPGPRDAARRADRAGNGQGPWVWRDLEVTVYGMTRMLRVLAYQVVWPEVLGLRPIRIVVVRDPAGKFRDAYLFTTDLGASVSWVVTTFARRWSIEVAFKASKQVMGIEGPQHWCQESIEKLAPWVWLMQSVVSLWYLTAGRALPEAESARRNLGPWDTEWSLGHWVRVLRIATMAATINPDCDENNDCRKLIERVKNYLFYVASAA
jgi:DDE superfamily endonuclease